MTLLTLLLTCVITACSPGVNAWRWPLGPPAPRVLRAFSPPAVPWGPGHRGVDLSARPGEPVYAAGAGRVSYAGRLAGRGVVAVDHGPLRTTYLPVRPSVEAGRPVTLGARIGVLEAGPLHCSTPCLHWGLRKGGVYLDPLSLVRREVRLLPQWPQSAPPQQAPPQQAPPQKAPLQGAPAQKAPAQRAPAQEAPPLKAPPQKASPPRRPAVLGAPVKDHERRSRSEQPPTPGMTLRDATTATGGAVTGLVLAYSLSFAWRRTRARGRSRRPPPGVIDLAHERRLRRVPQPRQERT